MKYQIINIIAMPFILLAIGLTTTNCSTKAIKTNKVESNTFFKHNFSFNSNSSARSPSGDNKRKMYKIFSSNSFLSKCLTHDWQLIKSCLKNRSPEPCVSNNNIECIKTTDDKIFPVSILTYDGVKEIYKELNDKPNEFYSYIKNGCGPRALNIAADFFYKEPSIHMANLMVDGDLGAAQFPDVNWKMHVAPFVFVRDGNELMRVIIDPLVLDIEDVSEEQWLNKIGATNNNQISKRVWGPFYSPNQSEVKKATERGNLKTSKTIFESFSIGSFKPGFQKDILDLFYLLALPIQRQKEMIK